LDRPIRSSINVDRPIKVYHMAATPVGTSPRVVGALPVILFGALNCNPSNPAAWKGNEEKSTFEKQKTWIPYVKPWKHKNYKSDAANVLFHNLSFRRGRFRFGKCGPSDQNLPRVSMPRVNKFPPNSYFFFQISHIGGPSDQSSVNVDRPIKICHVSSCHVSTYSCPINGTNQSTIDTWHAKLQHDV
jgi:hypothetical protein